MGYVLAVPKSQQVKSPAGSWRILPALRRFARDVARRWVPSAVLDEALAVIVTELVTNAVRHSGSPDVAVLLVAADGTITVHVQDTGRWYPRPPAPRVREDEAGDTACCGRGLQMVEAYADSCAVMITAGGTRVTAELVPAADGPQPLDSGSPGPADGRVVSAGKI